MEPLLSFNFMTCLAEAAPAIPGNHPQGLILAPPNTSVLWVLAAQRQGIPKHKETWKEEDSLRFALSLLIREIWGFASFFC